MVKDVIQKGVKVMMNSYYVSWVQSSRFIAKEAKEEIWSQRIQIFPQEAEK